MLWKEIHFYGMIFKFCIKAVFSSYNKHYPFYCFYFYFCLCFFIFICWNIKIKIAFFHVMRFLLFYCEDTSFKNYYCLFQEKILWKRKYKIQFCAMKIQCFFIFFELESSLRVTVLYCKSKEIVILFTWNL